MGREVSPLAFDKMPVLTPSNNLSMPAAVEQHKVITGLSSLAPRDDSEAIQLFTAPGQRLGLSLMEVKGTVKVAGVSDQGVARSHLSIGDIILQVNNQPVHSEKMGNKLILGADRGVVTLKVIKRDRGRDSEGLDSGASTERTAPSSTDNSARAVELSPPTSTPRKLSRIASFGRRNSKPQDNNVTL